MKPTEYKQIEYIQQQPKINGKVERTASGKIVISATVEGAGSPVALGSLLSDALREVRHVAQQLEEEKESK